MKNNFQKFQKMPLFFSIIFLAFSCSLFFFLYKEMQNNVKTFEQAETIQQSEAVKQNEIQFLNDLLATVEQERALLETYFIKSSDVVPFLDMIEKLALKVGAKAEIVLVDIPKDNSGLIVEMKVTGYFEALYKFLTLLENSPYELNFISMNMQKLGGEALSGEENSFPTWSTVFRVKLLNFIQ